jgi:hypothetical protein
MVEIEGLHEINHEKLCYSLVANQQQQCYSSAVALKQKSWVIVEVSFCGIKYICLTMINYPSTHKLWHKSHFYHKP